MIDTIIEVICAAILLFWSLPAIIGALCFIGAIVWAGVSAFRGLI